MLDTAFKAAIVIDLLDRFTGPMKHVQATIKNFEDAATIFRKIGAGMFAAGAGIIATGGAFVSTAAQVETYKSTLETMLGSVEEANKRFKELSEFARTTPFELPEVVELGNQLQAIGRYSKENMTILGDLAAAANKPIGQAVTAFQKLATGQKGEAVRMFQDLLISTQDWVKYTGKGVSKSGELLATTEEMIAALPKIMEAKGFSGMMDKQSKTFKGAMSNLSDAFFRFRMLFGEGLLDPFKKLIQGITSVIDRINAWAEANPEASKTIARLVGVVGVLLMSLGMTLFVAGSLIPALKNLKLAFQEVGTAMKFLTKANIWILVITTLITLIVILFNTCKPFRVFIINMINAILFGIGYIAGLFVKVGKIIFGFFVGVGKAFVDFQVKFNPFVAIPLLIIKNWSKIKSFFTSFWNALKSGPVGFVNWLISLVNRFIDSLNAFKIVIPSWIPKIGGQVFGLNIPKIPMLASGGIIASSGLAVVGEKGPELVHLPTGAKVYSNNYSKMLGETHYHTHYNHIELKVDNIESLEAIENIFRQLERYAEASC